MPEKKKVKKKSRSKARPLKNYQLKDEKKNRRSPKKKRLIVVLIILAAVLGIIILALLFEFGFVNPSSIKNPLAKPETYYVEDQCSLIVGQLIHTIASEDICEVRCKTECELREMNFHNSEFTAKENDCNMCRCECK